MEAQHYWVAPRPRVLSFIWVRQWTSSWTAESLGTKQSPAKLQKFGLDLAHTHVYVFFWVSDRQKLSLWTNFISTWGLIFKDAVFFTLPKCCSSILHDGLFLRYTSFVKPSIGTEKASIFHSLFSFFIVPTALTFSLTSLNSILYISHSPNTFYLNDGTGISQLWTNRNSVDTQVWWGEITFWPAVMKV